eukprot:NODE_2216_length_1247_cov_37.170536_g2105_i0.p1 GENE.NODE_2216_length_1247_cov_37.170536_g2105_i0~~NODE_2216_length_1247_cov_37.170536_g2105_i0.p1  ORF type:complete len:331 (-),score=67.84 NODE_2216_length_1247_cov_37.170536_g2105_i0:199-1191(-)
MLSPCTPRLKTTQEQWMKQTLYTFAQRPKRSRSADKPTPTDAIAAACQLISRREADILRAVNFGQQLLGQVQELEGHNKRLVLEKTFARHASRLAQQKTGELCNHIDTLQNEIAEHVCHSVSKDNRISRLEELLRQSGTELEDLRQATLNGQLLSPHAYSIPNSSLSDCVPALRELRPAVTHMRTELRELRAAVAALQQMVTTTLTTVTTSATYPREHVTSANWWKPRQHVILEGLAEAAAAEEAAAERLKKVNRALKVADRRLTTVTGERDQAIAQLREVCTQSREHSNTLQAVLSNALHERDEAMALLLQRDANPRFKPTPSVTQLVC